MKKEPDKTKTTFRCPICKRYIEIGAWGESPHPNEPQSARNVEYRLANKRYHMERHREVKRAKEKKLRTARRQAAVVRL